MTSIFLFPSASTFALLGVFCTTHNVMAESRKMKFLDQPTSSPEYVKFLVSNKDGGLLELVRPKLSTAESPLCSTNDI